MVLALNLSGALLVGCNTTDVGKTAKLLEISQILHQANFLEDALMLDNLNEQELDSVVMVLSSLTKYQDLFTTELPTIAQLKRNLIEVKYLYKTIQPIVRAHWLDYTQEQRYRLLMLEVDLKELEEAAILAIRTSNNVELAKNVLNTSLSVLSIVAKVAI